jgi:outer membrane receptor protein involved in Fe transport
VLDNRLASAVCRALLLSSALAPASVLAQEAASASRSSAKDLDTVIVTGRSGTGVRTKAETSYSITNIEEEQLRMQAPTSVTEALKSVPGFWVEASGGEASGNIRARGIPVDGFGSVTLLEDGIPVVHDPALGYLNGDQAFRLDETIERIEVVRGGPASVMYSNAPAGAINFIPRQVGEDASGVFKYTVGDSGLNRLDFAYGSPLANGWKLLLGGFYRVEDGVRDPGFNGNDGGQFRLNLAREFEGGRFSIDAKRMDDRVALYLGIPMYTNGDGDIRAVPGFDGNHGTLAGPETRYLSMKTADGRGWDFDNSEGTHVKRDQLTFKLETGLGGDWELAQSARFSRTDTIRNGVFPNSLTPAATFLAGQKNLLASVPGATALGLRYVNGSGGFDTASQNGNGLMVIGGLRGLDIPVREFVSDTRLMRSFALGGQQHDLTLGYYLASTREDYTRYSSSVLMDATDNAGLLDLVALDANGNVLRTLSDNGVWRYGYEWNNASGEQKTQAFYVSDEWQVNDRLRIDSGLRWEKASSSGWNEVRRSVDGGTLATSQMLAGSGLYVNHDLESDDLGWSIGANWQFNDGMGVFGRWTSAFRLPSLGNYITRNDNCDATSAATVAACASANGKAADTQTMDLAEVGFKFANPLFSAYATAFYTKYDNVGFSNYRFNPDTGVSTREAGYASTRTFGLELETAWYPADWFDLRVNATWQDAQYRDLRYSELVNGAPVLRDFVGNQLIRVPELGARVVAGINLLDQRLRLQAAAEHQGERYVDTANSVRLPSYQLLNLSARYELSERVSMYGYVDNVTNSLGLTEGNPRAGELASSDAGASAFIARPLLGRNYRLALMYRF